jgi:hypothetical protein
MSHSQDAEPFVVAEWRAALHDAGVDEDDFHLITCPGSAVTGHAKAASFDKGVVLNGDAEEGGIVVQAERLAEANAPGTLWRHRVAVYEDLDEDDVVELAYLAGVLRHEIEHGRQRDAARDAFALYDLVDVVCSSAADGDIERYHDLINGQPLEVDGHAAASAHVRARYPEAVPELLGGPDKYLVEQSSPPADPETLLDRTIEYLWQFRETCNEPARLPAGKTFCVILDSRLPDTCAGDRWRELERGLAEAEADD